MQTLQAPPRPQPRGEVSHRSARAPRPNRTENAPRPSRNGNQHQPQHQRLHQNHPHQHSRRIRLDAPPRYAPMANQPPPPPPVQLNTENAESNIFNHLGDLVVPSIIPTGRAPPVNHTIELVDDPIDIITFSSIFGINEDEDEVENNELTSDPFYPIKSQYELTIQELKRESVHTKRLLQSKLEVSERRIQDLEKYEQLIEQCSPQQIQKMSLDECSTMKNKVKSLLFALEHEELKLVKEKIRKDCYEDLYYCLICQEQERNVCFDPCGHFCLCHGCVETKNILTCPICRASITDSRRIFLG